MSDKLREAAQAAYKAMIAAELSDGSKREWDAAVDGLKDALAEPAIKESLTAQRPWVGLTDEERRGLREWQKIQEELGPVWAPMMLYLYEALEAKLKDKNCG